MLRDYFIEIYEKVFGSESFVNFNVFDKLCFGP